MILNKIKTLLNKNNKPCVYSFITNKHYRMIYLHSNLSESEKKVNKNALNGTNITTVAHGIKLFNRFLKYHNIYEQYKFFLKTYYFRIDFIIQYNFLTPFEPIIKRLEIYHSKEFVKKYIDLEKEWQRLLESINYI